MTITPTRSIASIVEQVAGAVADRDPKLGLSRDQAGELRDLLGDLIDADAERAGGSRSQHALDNGDALQTYDLLHDRATFGRAF